MWTLYKSNLTEISVLAISIYIFIYEYYDLSGHVQLIAQSPYNYMVDTVKHLNFVSI